MNMETEMEWNAHMMKSGRVFGTYDFMISKGHTLAEMNYVIWDVEDNSYMPLVKAVAVTLDTHPDILLKDNAMGQAIEDDQATQMQERLVQQRQQYPQATQTGGELMQGGKYGQAALTGLRNALSGGRYSSGEPRDVDAQAPGGARERMKRLDPVLHPIRAFGAIAGGVRDRGIQSRAGATTAQQERNLSQLTNGGRLNRDDLNDKEKGQYDKIKRLLEGDNTDMGSKKRMTDTETSRGFGDRMMDASNAKWKGKNPDSLNSQAPYPNRYDYLIDAGEPAIDDMNEDDLNAVEDTEAGMNTDNSAALTDTPVTEQPNEEMPEDSVVNPRHAEIENAVRTSGYSKERLQPVIDQLKAWYDGLGGEQATLEGLKKIGFAGRQAGGAPAKLIIAALSTLWDLTPKQEEQLLHRLGDEDEKPLGDEDEKPLGDDDEEPIGDEDEKPLGVTNVPISAENRRIIDDAKANYKAERQAAWEAQGGQEARDAELAAEKKAAEKKGVGKKAAEKGDVGKKKGPPPKQEKKPRHERDPGEDIFHSSDAVDSAWDYLTLLKGR